MPADVRRRPAPTWRVFRLAVGRQFTVHARNRIGWLELHVGRVVGEKSYTHSIWIEPRYVRVVRRRPATA